MYKALVGVMSTYQSQLIVALSDVMEESDKTVFRFSYIDCHDADGPIIMEEHTDGSVFYMYDTKSNPTKAGEVLVLPLHTDEDELLSFLKMLYTRRIPVVEVDFTNFGTKTYQSQVTEVLNQ